MKNAVQNIKLTHLQNNYINININNDYRPTPKTMQVPANSKFQILYISFNQDGTCISVGTRRGFRIFNAAPFKPLYAHEFQDGCSIVSMLYRSSILAITGAGNNIRYPKNSVTVYDDQSGRNLGEVDLHHTILNITMTREKIFTVLENQILVHNISDLRQIDKIETPPNPHGLMCVHGEQDILLLTLGPKTGEVILRQYSNNSLLQVQTIKCHDSAVRCVAFSPDGQYFATASVKGTLIRIYAIKDKKLIKELRRGTKESTICCIAFSPDSTRLACTSNHGTLHVFAAVPAAQSSTQQGNKKSSLQFLAKLSKYFDSEWSFAQYDLQCPAAICRFINENELVTASASGQVLRLRVDGQRLVREDESDMLHEQ